jgi:hypothetical protein
VAAKLDERITGLEEQLKQLRTRQQRIEARKRALLSRRERAADTRRKILVGAIVLAKVEQGELEAGRLRGWLDAALTRDDDRALFVDLGVSEPRVAGTVPGRAAD